MAVPPRAHYLILRIFRLRPIGATTAQTTATEFQRKFGEFQHKALREPVEITRHGRRELVLMSADHYDWLVAAARRAHRTGDAAAVVSAALERTEMDPETETERVKREERALRGRITAFQASDRPSRDDLHRRGI